MTIQWGRYEEDEDDEDKEDQDENAEDETMRSWMERVRGWQVEKKRWWGWGCCLLCVGWYHIPCGGRIGNETLLLVYKSGEVILYCISSISFAFEKDVKNFLSLEELLLSNKEQQRFWLTAMGEFAWAKLNFLCFSRIYSLPGGGRNQNAWSSDWRPLRWRRLLMLSWWGAHCCAIFLCCLGENLIDD